MKKIFIWIGVIVVFLLGVILFFYPNKEKVEPSKFSETELLWIETLSENDQTYFLEHQNLHSLLKQKTFQVSNFSNYLSYYKAHSDFDFNTILLIVNHNLQDETIDDRLLDLFNINHFEPSRLQRYIAYEKENPTLELDKVVSFVNQDIDEITMKYNDKIEDFMNYKYFIKENLNRYIDYKETNNTGIASTVADVNSNLDYAYYTNTQEADLDKGNLILVNKYYVLKDDYVPTDMVTIESKYGVEQFLKREAYEAFKKMADDASKEGLTLWITSPYRSYQTQSSLYNGYSAKDGQENADTYSARPGYSEHQTGLAADIVNGPWKSLGSFEKTKEFEWMKSHAHLYGFILRYPNSADKIRKTGYQYEPWHYRYLGVDVATKVYNSNLTYEEYYAYYIK